MKKKNGFTLVELVAILAVLGVIAILVLPGVKSNINNKKEKQYNNIVNVIENAAKSYYYQTSSGTKITLEELANNKYIDPDITNPKTNEKMTGCVIVSKDNGYNTFKYIDDLSLCDKSLAGYITSLYNDDGTRVKNGLKKDNTSDENIRYEGSNPNNYVKFNNELWRIIGVFGSNVKIIRSESIGKLSRDSSESSVNGGNGVNEWSISDLKEYLNTMYYGGSTVTCYAERNNATTICPKVSLNSDAKQFIDNHTWNVSSSDYIESLSTVDSYNKERGTTTGKTCTGGSYCNDTVERTTSWTGYVALPYLTDWAYASSESICKTSIYTKDTNDNYICKNNNWMHYGSTITDRVWTLSSSYGSTYACSVWIVYGDGHVHSIGSAFPITVFPTVYLKSNVKVAGGSGTSTDPYILSRS